MALLLLLLLLPLVDPASRASKSAMSMYFLPLLPLLPLPLLPLLLETDGLLLRPPSAPGHVAACDAPTSSGAKDPPNGFSNDPTEPRRLRAKTLFPLPLPLLLPLLLLLEPRLNSLLLVGEKSSREKGEGTLPLTVVAGSSNSCCCCCC